VQVLDVLKNTGREVVNANDGMSLCEQAVSEV
jgi:hypothetical protein